MESWLLGWLIGSIAVLLILLPENFRELQK